jgi:hypothetical protein
MAMPIAEMTLNSDNPPAAGIAIVISFVPGFHHRCDEASSAIF